MQKRLEIVRYWLLTGLVFAMPMSFTPSIALPMLDFPSFRIGLYQVLAALFVLASLPLVWKSAPKLIKNRWFLTSASLTLSAFVVGLATTNAPARTMLYGASLTALLVLGLCGYEVWKRLNKVQVKTIVTTLLWSGVVFGALAVMQLVVASFDKTALGTLCTGCSDAVFGFPRINLFAAEPQFFANSLLPALIASFFFRKNARLANWTLVLTSIAIGLTFSRGALVAVVASFGVYIVIQLVRKRSIMPFLRLAAISAGSIFVAFAMLVGSAALRYNETPYIAYNTTVSMIDHLSLGTVNIAQKSVEVAPPAAVITTTDTNDFAPEGFVEASSNDRLSAASLAINAWDDSLKTMLFGVGMGNLGPYINVFVANAPSNLTVYIWYVLVLSELGIIGLVGLLIAPLYILWKALSSKSSALNAFVITTLVALLVQLFFFGSYINVMYLYLLVGIFAATLRPKPALRKR